MKVQIEGKAVWTGSLPEHVTFQHILQDWQQVRSSLGLFTSARVGSGPNRPDPQATLLEAMNDTQAPGFVSRNGCLLVTIFPETRGGGAKDERYTTCQTQLARELLEHGASLSDSSTIVDRLLPQAGLARVQRALAIVHADNRWQQILQLCRQFEVTIPPLGARLEKAQQRVRAKAKARAQHHQQNVKASSFRLQEGYFFNADGSPTCILQQMLPGSSGIILLDPEEAGQHLQMRAMDELGILVLGHTCPCVASCSGPLTLPAVNALSEPVLIKACLHQLGDRKISVKCQHSAEVQAEEAICCAFAAYQDDWSESEWKVLKANPVRTMLNIWKKGGIDLPFTSPWGRSYRDHHDASSQASCPTLQFHARVSKPTLACLLQKSGYNRIYVTPKSWVGEVLSGYAIIWVPAPRDEVSAAAMGLQEQCGLVRSKMRFGVRVPEPSFSKAFEQLRPGADMPLRLQIRDTYRLSGLPPGLRSEDIARWGTAVAWPLRPLRPLGPRQWIVGASSGPPDGHLSMNAQSILVQKVAPKSTSQPVVCAGRIPPSTVTDSQGSEDPWLQSDP